MIKCEICGREFKSGRAIGPHLSKSHNIVIKDYYDKYLKKEDDGKCKTCGKNTSFRNMIIGYSLFCSNRCSTLNLDVQKKRKETSLKKYGTESPLQSNIVKDKYKQTCLNKYGVENVSQVSSILKTRTESFLSRTDEQKEESELKKKKTNLEKYGSEEYFCSDNFNTKRKQTSLEKYGTTHPNKSVIVKNKWESTNLQKYDSINVMHNKEIKNKSCATFRKNFIKNNVLKYLNILNLELIGEYLNNLDLLEIRCLKCGNIYKKSYFNIQQGSHPCTVCYPSLVGKSKQENELYDFISNLLNDNEIIRNDRKLIYPYEIDIIVPKYKTCIEYNGLYWHSDDFLDKNYHLNKLNRCDKEGYKLIQIFEDEWILKNEIVKSRLRNIFKKIHNRIYARQCIIKELDVITKNNFLIENHLQGRDISKIRLGAFYKDELVSVMTFSKGNISKGSTNNIDEWELNRFCSKLNYNIIGIASKLLNYFKENYKWKIIFSYADRRWSTGELYENLNMKLSHTTEPNYWYIKGMNRIHRFNLRKQSHEPKDIPEWVLRQNEGYLKIWDCGNLKFSIVN